MRRLQFNNVCRITEPVISSLSSFVLKILRLYYEEKLYKIQKTNQNGVFN